jgi:hypothetical protein
LLHRAAKDDVVDLSGLKTGALNCMPNCVTAEHRRFCVVE